MLANLVRVTLSNPGTVNVGTVVTLGSAAAPFRSFHSKFAIGETCYFFLTDGARTLVGTWTLGSSGGTPVATVASIIENSETGGTGAMTFTGICTAYSDLPAQRVTDVGTSYTLQADAALDITIPATGSVFEVVGTIGGLAGATAGRYIAGFASIDGTNFLATNEYSCETDLAYGSSVVAGQSNGVGIIPISALHDVGAARSRLVMQIFADPAASGLLWTLGYTYDAGTRAHRRGWAEVNVAGRIAKLRLVGSNGSGLRAGTSLSVRRIG